MSNVFTEKQLEQDSYLISIIILVLCFFLLSGWLLWAFKAHVSIYEESSDAMVIDANHIKAIFPLSSTSMITTGQLAVVELNNLPWPAFPKLHGTVISLLPNTQLKNLAVYISLENEPNQFSKLVHMMPAEVNIEVGKVKPVNLLVKSLSEIL